MGIFEHATEAAEFIRAGIDVKPRIAIVLGSGLGEVARQVEGATHIPYEEIPHFPRSTVEGHRGALVAGLLAGVPVAVMQGRVHAYEGYGPDQVTFPMRVLGRLGISTVIVTNAAGGIRLGMLQGELVLLSDQINLTGINPASGPNDARFGLRFFDMSEPYSSRLRDIAHAAADSEDMPLSEGVYLGISGPSFETPAEIRAFRTMGADLVGMSTVHEVIIARHMGIEVLGISCVTNIAAGLSKQLLNHEEVMETGLRVQGKLSALLSRILPRI